AGASAALLAVGNFEKRDAGNGGEQRARLGLDPLRVRQVAGVVHRDPERKRPARGPRRGGGGETLVDVADLGGELPRGRIVGKEAGVVLEVRSAAGGIDEDEVPGVAGEPGGPGG